MACGNGGDVAFRGAGVGGQVLDQVHRGGAAGQHQARDFRAGDAGGVPAARPHAHALPLRHTEGGQRGQVGAAVGGAAGHDLDDGASQGHDGLLREQVFFQTGDFRGPAAVVDPQQFGVAAGARIEQVLLPEVSGGIGVQRHAVAVRHGLAQHPAIGVEGVRREVVDFKLRVARHAEPCDGLAPRLGNSAS
ncbi:hypothetical protein D3C72_1772510 [compost metagenome]